MSRNGFHKLAEALEKKEKIEGDEFRKMIKKGADEWHQWKMENSSKGIYYNNVDINGKMLHNFDFSKVSFRGCNFYYARFYDCNLSSATFQNCNLEGTKFYSKDLIDITISSSDLTEASFDRCDMSGAHLFRLKLSRADIHQVNLSHAEISFTDFNDTSIIDVDLHEASISHLQLNSIDLRGFQNLETVKHIGPSSIGIDTIYASEGCIPDIFLKRVGVPKIIIEYLPSLISLKPIQRHKCMVSYSRKDMEFATKLTDALEEKEVNCWIDKRNLPTGSRFRSRIEEAIHTYDKVIVILSKDSIDSEWVENEVEAVLEREDREKKDILMPINIDDSYLTTTCAWAATIRRKHTILDFLQWDNWKEFQESLMKLVLDLTKNDVVQAPNNGKGD